jgi:hypothetical protein
MESHRVIRSIFMRALRTIVAGLAILFVGVFTSTVLGAYDHPVPRLIAMILPVSVIAAAAFLAGRTWNPFAAGAAGGLFAILCVIVWFEASYLAHVSGWGGLDIDDFGSEDMPGQDFLLALFVYGTPYLIPVLIFGAGFGAAGAVTRSRRQT